MHLSHPETTPLPLVHGKIVFCETRPWCRKGFQMHSKAHAHRWRAGLLYEGLSAGRGGVLEGSAAEALTLLLPVPGAGSAHGLPLPS